MGNLVKAVTCRGNTNFRVLGLLSDRWRWFWPVLPYAPPDTRPRPTSND